MKVTRKLSNASTHQYLIQLIITLFILSLTSPLHAAIVTLSWDANDTAPDGYHLYARAEGMNYNFTDPVWSGNDTTAAVTLEDNTSYYFVVKAFIGSDESENSNEAFTTTHLNSYNINTSVGSGGTISPAGDSNVSEGASIQYTITPNTDYYIEDVKVDGVSIGATPTYEFTAVSAGHTIEATFATHTVETFSIRAGGDSTGNISPSGTINVPLGSNQTFTITPHPGYQVSNIWVDGSSAGAVSTYTFSNISANHVIAASFSVAENNTVSITATAGQNGTITPIGTTQLLSGDNQTYTINPNTGYKIADVKVNGISHGPISTYSFAGVSENAIIEATFENIMFAINASADTGGTITPSGSLAVAYGSSQAFSVTPLEGYQILDLFIDGVSNSTTNPIIFSNINSNHTIQATFEAVNTPPTANAGPDQTVDEGVLVTLSGLNSIDPDDGIASLQWEQLSGPIVTLSAPDEMENTFLTPDVDPNGTSLTFQLTVTDYSGATSTDTCIVNISWVNLPPVANTLSSLTFKEGEIVTLDATDSYDPDDGIQGFFWEQLSGTSVTLSDVTSEISEFTAPSVPSEGVSLSFQVTVTDMGGLQSQASCIVNIISNNIPPQSDAGSDQTVNTNEWIFLKGDGSSDSDDGIKSYLWAQTAGTPVGISDVTAMNPGFTAPAIETDQEVLEFTLTVTDNSGMKHTDTSTVTVLRQNDMTGPEVDITAPTSESSFKSSSSTLTLSGTTFDESGVNLVYWWTNKNQSGRATGTDTWTIKDIRLKKGVNKITVAARDKAGNRTSKTISVRY